MTVTQPTNEPLSVLYYCFSSLWHAIFAFSSKQRLQPLPTFLQVCFVEKKATSFFISELLLGKTRKILGWPGVLVEFPIFTCSADTIKHVFFLI